MLAITMGARPRRLTCEGADLQNVYYLRSVADARLLKTVAAAAEHIVVIGAGFIGLEVAAALAQQHKQVTVIEAANRALERVVSPEISAFLRSAHVGHGVKMLTSSTVQSLVGEKLFGE